MIGAIALQIVNQRSAIDATAAAWTTMPPKPAAPAASPPPPPAQPAYLVAQQAGQSVTTATGLKVAIMEMGTGPQATPGHVVTVNYKGTLDDGTVFDSTDTHGAFSFPLGAGRVIKGWDEGVAGMKIGEKRKLIIPPQLGYGVNGTPGGPIPPNATLTFEVQLLGVK